MWGSEFQGCNWSVVPICSLSSIFVLFHGVLHLYHWVFSPPGWHHFFDPTVMSHWNHIMTSPLVISHSKPVVTPQLWSMELTYSYFYQRSYHKSAMNPIKSMNISIFLGWITIVHHFPLVFLCFSDGFVWWGTTYLLFFSGADPSIRTWFLWGTACSTSPELSVSYPLVN